MKNLKLIFFLFVININLSFAFDINSKTINFINPFPPGGGVDRVFRPLEKYSLDKKINFVTIYKPGADGIIAMNELTKMPNDGYTIAIVTAGVIAEYELTYPNSKFTIITGINDTIGAFVVRPNIGINNIKDLEKALQQGNDIKFGYGAPAQKILLQQFFKLSKLKQEPMLVPYKGGLQAVNAVLGDQIDVVRVPFILVKPFIDSGQLKLLAVTRKKIKGYSAPTIESVYPTWQEIDGYGVIAPPNVDTTTVKVWSDYLESYLETKSVREEFEKDYIVGLPFGEKNFRQIIDTIKLWKTN